ncbi:MAG: 16S rRNA (guanine(966)-N(2))-methyltransferase RsmD [Elusimicrobiota bacterium]
MAMKIIAGTARGRSILTTPKDIMVRPISGRMRQSLFDVLKPRITGSYFLDLFAGTGAVGLEALSRGALKVCFVEKDPRCLKVVAKNLARLQWEDKASVLRGNVLGPLSWTAHRAGVEAFDLVFLGPPYRDENNKMLAYSNPVLNHLAAGGILAANGWVICQHHKTEDLGKTVLKRFRTMRYGDTIMSFFQQR